MPAPQGAQSVAQPPETAAMLRHPRRGQLQARDLAEHGKRGIRRDRRVAVGRRRRVAVDGDDPQAQLLLRLAQREPVDLARSGGTGGKTGQRSVRLGKLQTAKARRIDRRRGIGRRRMPGQRQDRAIRQVLLDLAGQRSIELAQYDAQPGIGVARQQGRMQIELVVGRERQDRRPPGEPRQDPAPPGYPAGRQRNRRRLR